MTSSSVVFEKRRKTMPKISAHATIYKVERGGGGKGSCVLAGVNA